MVPQDFEDAPYDADLAADLAELLAAHGHHADALPYVQRALRFTRDDALRARLLKVQGAN